MTNTIAGFNDWNWDLITAVFKWPSDGFTNMEASQDYKIFLRRVVDFFKPTTGQFGKLELASKKSRFLAKTGCYILDYLSEGTSEEVVTIFDEFLGEIQQNFRLLIESKSVHECPFSPTKIATTCCQYYFFFVGKLSGSVAGRRGLDRHSILLSLVALLSLGSDLYLKLVISCLDYGTIEWESRTLLGKALKECSESCRLYATRFLGVLIRSRTTNVAHWGIDLLVAQLFDESPMIAWAALDILDDACDDKMNLEAVVCVLKSKPLSCLQHLGHKGVLFYTRFLTSTTGMNFLREMNYIEMELKRWGETFNNQYVGFIEELINDGLSRHQLNNNKTYGRRSHELYTVKNIFVPPHLYGQLSLSKIGLIYLEQDSTVNEIIRYLTFKAANCQDIEVDEWIKVKAAIWAVSHVALSPRGVEFVDGKGGLRSIVDLVEKCNVYSIRATGFYALGLIATTRYGSRALGTRGWYSLRYARDEQWPVVDDWFSGYLPEVNVDDGLSDFDNLSSLGAASIDEPPLKESADETSIPRDTSSTSIATPSSKTSVWSISKRKRLSSVFRSFSLGSSSGRKKREERKESVGRRHSFSKIKKTLFPLSTKDEEKGKGSETVEVKDAVIEKNVGSFQSKETEQKLKLLTSELLPEKAPIATPENSNSSDVPTDAEEPRLTVDLHEIKEEMSSTPIRVIEEPPAKSGGELSPIASSSLIAVKDDKKQPPHPPSAIKTFYKQIGDFQIQCKRSGQRAFSESEAQNVSASGYPYHQLLFMKGYKTSTNPSNRSVRSESWTSTRLPGPARISLISGTQHQPAHYLAPNQLPLQPGTSVTSVSSVGSWTDNPGFFTLRSLRKRPQLVEGDVNDAATSVVSRGATTGRETGYVLNEMSGLGFATPESRDIIYGIKRRDSWAKRFQSLDYRTKYRPLKDQAVVIRKRRWSRAFLLGDSLSSVIGRSFLPP